MIIIEGPDNSGKSTLANYIAREVNKPLHHFGGPPKNFTQLLSRINFCEQNHDQYVFDRIPLISEPVYSILRNRNLVHELNDAESHYRTLRDLEPIIIYCRPPRETMVKGHKGKQHDSQAQLDFIEENAEELITRYDEMMDNEFLSPTWTYDYTRDDPEVLVKQIKETLGIKDKERMGLVNDVYNFQTKILGLEFPDKPIYLQDDRKRQATEKLEEELQEFKDATEISEQADALIDLIYFALGELHQAGIDTQRVWDEVHKANMNKIVGITKRGHMNDAKKPDDWKAPDHTWLDKV